METGSKRRNAIPILYTSGSYYEVGFDVGRTFRGLIEDYLASNKDLHDFFLPAYQTEAGKEAYKATLKNLKRNFPHYVREVQGTADGAKVPFLHLMLLHMDLIVPNSAGMKSYYTTSGCSTICCNTDSQVVLGHTEDGNAETLNHVYIISAHIKEDVPQGRWGTREEKFTALSYAGQLPGFCMGYNNKGLVHAINIVYSKAVLAGKTPRHFLTRTLLSAGTIEEALDILKDCGTGSADGFSVNMQFSNKEGGHSFYNVEVGPAKDCEESPLSLLEVKPSEYYVHANTYLRLNIEEEHFTKSSEHRLARAAQCFPIYSKNTVLSLLSDTSDKDFPIFRDGGEKDSAVTVTVGIFDLVENTWSLWIKNPNSSEPVATLPLLL